MSNNVEAAQVCVMEDLGEWVAQIPFDVFVDHLLPKIVGFDPSATVLGLKQSGALIPNQDGNFSWSAFTAEPKYYDGPESLAFKPLETTHRQICAQFRGEISRPTASTSFVICGDSALTSEADLHHIPNFFQPCGYGYLNGSEKEFMQSDNRPDVATQGIDDWYNVVYVGDYKKEETRQGQNEAADKVIWGMQQIMRTDARRRFTFGFTIENTAMRVWFCSRQVVLVSEPFNFLEDPLKWVKLVVPLTFARTVDLGWDPTMDLKFDNQSSKFYYEITVTSDDKLVKRTYRTVNILSESSADTIRGRATRVFEAYEIDQQGERIEGCKNVAIKDFWLDSSREPEPIVLKRVLEDANDSVRSKFLTVVMWGKVSNKGSADSTDKIMNQLKLGPRGYEDPEHPEPVQFYLRRHHLNQSMQRSGSSGLLSNLGFDLFTPSVVSFDAKTHLRIVFKEVGYPLYDETSIRTIFKAARDVAEALEFMSKKQYVHRDVSAGNILIVDGKAKLSDLEYAQMPATGGRHGVRTGTIAFMAAEVATGQYGFSMKSYRPGRTQNGPIEFVHNPLHDLESLWWILVWVLFCKTPTTEAQADKVSDFLEHRKNVRQLFPRRLDEGSRAWAFISGGFDHGTCLSPSLLSYLFYVAGINALLIESYEAAEATLYLDHNINHAAWSTTHQSFIQVIDNILADPNCDDLTLYPIKNLGQNVLKFKAPVKSQWKLGKNK